MVVTLETATLFFCRQRSQRRSQRRSQLGREVHCACAEVRDVAVDDVFALAAQQAQRGALGTEASLPQKLNERVETFVFEIILISSLVEKLYLSNDVFKSARGINARFQPYRFFQIVVTSPGKRSCTATVRRTAVSDVGSTASRNDVIGTSAQ